MKTNTLAKHLITGLPKLQELQVGNMVTSDEDISLLLQFDLGKASYIDLSEHTYGISVHCYHNSHARWYKHWELQKLSGGKVKYVSGVVIEALDQPKRYCVHFLMD